MAYRALYREWRPNVFAEVLGPERSRENAAQADYDGKNRARVSVLRFQGNG